MEAMSSFDPASRDASTPGPADPETPAAETQEESAPLEPAVEPEVAEPGTEVAWTAELGAEVADPEAAERDPGTAELVEPAEPEPEPAEPEPEAAEPEVVETEVRVMLQRSVRYGPVLVGFAVLGALAGVVACLLFPIAGDAEYTMAQVAGFMAMIGGAIGLLVGGVLALILTLVAKRRRGTGVAIQADVR